MDSSSVQQKWRYWITALPMESRAIWHYWGKGQIVDQYGSMRLLQLTNQWMLAEVGIGLAEAERLYQWWKMYPPEEVWNIGISGALIPGWEIGDIAVVQKSCNENANCLCLKTTPFSNVKRVTQVTVSSPIMSKTKALELHEKTGAVLVDMELYWIVELSQRLSKISFYSFRVISDFADENTPDSIRRNRGKIQQALRQIVGTLRLK